MRKLVCLSVMSLVITIAVSAVSAQVSRDVPMFSPTIDGEITQNEIQSQLEIPMVWPVPGGSLLLEGSGSSEEEISATWYVSWDSVNLFISAVVKDDTPIYGNFSPGPYNGQDTVQPTFNPFNDPDHPFPPDPGGGPAAIYDIVVNTADDIGPDIYRHGALLTDDGYESITVGGQETDIGYIVETSIPWATAMDEVDPDYAPKPGDQHGLSFILVSYAEETGELADIATLITDFGGGANTIAEPSTWNSITLLAAADALQAGDADQDLDFDQFDLIQVQQAAKYLTGEAATWAEGDWDNAPGGSPDNPPPGDGLFNQLDIIKALEAGLYLTGPYAALASAGSMATHGETVADIPIPEPSTTVVVGLALVGLLWLVDRRR